jgi:hypothetical protein
MIEINGECDNATEELRPQKYVRRDFAPGHREELLPLVFLPYVYPATLLPILLLRPPSPTSAVSYRRPVLSY